MRPTISAKKDTSSALDKRRAATPLVGIIGEMYDSAWRSRLQAAVDGDGRSMREISLAAGLSHGYLHGVLKDGKEPTLDRFARICQEMHLSVAYILLGLDISEETEALISYAVKNPSRLTALVALLSQDA